MLYFFSAIKDAYADSIELRNRNQKYGQINNFVSTCDDTSSLALSGHDRITRARTLDACDPIRGWLSHSEQVFEEGGHRPSI